MNGTEFPKKLWVVVLMILAVVIVLIWGCYGQDSLINTFSDTTVATPIITTTTTIEPTTTTLGSTTTTIYYHPIPKPVRLVIPSVHLDTMVRSVGILPDGSMEIPGYQTVGWFAVGPAPGEKGASVLVGHVSWKGNKGVFYDLKNLRKGDTLYVYNMGGDFAEFEVDEVETVLKTELPTEKIWNKTDESVIRLVTCGGEFDKTTKHYVANVIVYAHLEK
jgi:LPXTG-site transpeptidase (sortase) family protein